MEIIGRDLEYEIMRGLLKSPKAEFLAVYGRRRIGKTYLIKNVFENEMAFEFTGTQYGSMQNQISKFFDKINYHFPNETQQNLPKTWAEAFFVLRLYLSKNKSKKKVVFFDELPWIAGKRSNFLEELAYWWNDWASHQNIIVVICGSAASWMINKVVNNKGGLHNRVTKRINLKPFSLSETKTYLKKMGVIWNEYQIIQLYMIVGGVPSYLNEVKKGETVTQTINRIFYGEESFMVNEFHNLYAALFEGHENHIEIIKTIGSRWQGMSRTEIIKNSKITNGGGLSNILKELEMSSFITKIRPIGKKQNDVLYRLSDEYSHFYLKFIDKKTSNTKNEWLKISQSPQYQNWSGYSFENVCFKHIEAIKMVLGISGINTEISSFWHKGSANHKEFQIDLLIERADNVINICEIKFTNNEFQMEKEYSDKLRTRREAFRTLSKTKKILFNTLISSFEVKNIENSGQIDQSITMDKLFLTKTL